MNARWDTGRTETFSDCVLAIAITLLVLNLRVPATDFRHLWGGIAHQWPAYVSYATSFITIGWIWLAHHGFFDRLRYVDSTIMRLNLLLLMAVAFLPFPTSLMAQAIRNVDAVRTAVIFYGGVLLTISLLFGAMARAAARRPELIRPEVTHDEIDELVGATRPSIGIYAAGAALAALAPPVAVFGYLLIAIAVVMRARGDETSPPPTTPTRRKDAHHNQAQPVTEVASDPSQRRGDSRPWPTGS
jgi:uncharacterized membrane protein